MNRLFAVIAVLCFTLGAFAADAPAPVPLLPQSFAGWQRGAVKHGTDPAQADAAMPGVLKEYGFHDFESAQYTREGRNITVKAARFENVTGAFGAFTFYRTPDMIPEKVGDDAASGANKRILIWRSNVLVDATLDQLTAMSASELRELAQDLPNAQGNDATPPTLPGYLPKQKMVTGTLRYVLGPNALEALHAPVTAEQVNFQKYGSDAEVAFADYADNGDHSTMVVISYPTNQIATERLQNFQNTMGSAPNFVSKRSGDKVVLMTGNLSTGDERALVGTVNFDATVSWTERTKLAAKDNIGNLIVGMFTLAGILMVIGLIFGVAFGGIRVLFQRVLPGRFHKEDDEEFISLDLR